MSQFILPYFTLRTNYIIRAMLICMSMFSSQLPFAQQSPLSIQVDVSKPVGEMRPFWAFFGYDEPNYTTRKNSLQLLDQLQQFSPVPVYVRTHNLLTSKGNSVGPDLKWSYTDAYKEDPNGNPIYNWTIVDSIIDTYIERG